MSPELIAILAVGVALAGVVLAGRRDGAAGQRALREEMHDLREEMRKEMHDLREEMRKEMRDLREDMHGRFAAVEDRLAAVDRGQAELRERLARLEGLLDGLREAVAGRRTEAAE